ncbi:MAG: CPBP family intramembrane metalloprotease [Verrucomicrobia bacterium]|nr:CPBP family intramembrane metalloprotease [Verrucomicrobiota bacterium]
METPPQLPPETGEAPPVLAPPTRTGWRRLNARVVVGLGLLLSSAGLGLIVEGELGSFLAASWEVVLFAILCVLAYLGLESVSARWLSRLLGGGLLLLGVGFNLLITYSALTPDLEADAVEGTWSLVGTVGAVSLLALVVGGLALIPGSRRFLSRITPDQEWTSVRSLALALVLAFTLVSLAPLIVLGSAPLLLLLQSLPNAETFFADERGVAGLFRDQLYSLCWTLVAAVWAVGYGIRRNWTETLERLGLRRLNRRDWLVAGILTAVVFGQGALGDWAITRVWTALNWPVTDAATLELMFAPFISITGAVVIGVTAGLGEEVAVRGILQPRVGILLSNAFFTSLHAYQYGWDGLTSVFLTGLCLGLIRQHTSTSVSAIVHGGFDFILVMLEVSATPQ